MPTPRPLRWFQFSIGTWLLVVAIIGWGLATRPYFVQSKSWSEVPKAVDPMESKENWLRVEVWDSKRMWLIESDSLNPALRWPAIALAALVLWKVASGLRQWRASRRANHSTPTEPTA